MKRTQKFMLTPAERLFLSRFGALETIGGVVTLLGLDEEETAFYVGYLRAHGAGAPTVNNKSERFLELDAKHTYWKSVKEASDELRDLAPIRH